MFITHFRVRCTAFNCVSYWKYRAAHC